MRGSRRMAKVAGRAFRPRPTYTKGDGRRFLNRVSRHKVAPQFEGTESAMFEAFILIPVHDNDGSTFTRADYLAFEALIGTFSSGATLRGRVSGRWLDSGQTFREPLREYEIAMESLRQIAPFLDAAEWARVHFRQLAVYVKVAGVVEIITGP